MLRAITSNAHCQFREIILVMLAKYLVFTRYFGKLKYLTITSSKVDCYQCSPCGKNTIKGKKERKMNKMKKKKEKKKKERREK